MVPWIQTIHKLIEGVDAPVVMNYNPKSIKSKLKLEIVWCIKRKSNKSLNCNKVVITFLKQKAIKLLGPRKKYIKIYNCIIS